jgi:hypothetical protein
VRRLALAAVLLVALPATCHAQSTSFIGVELSPTGAVAQEIPVQVSGVVSVDFHGDRAAGCEQSGTCDVSGNETWDPGPRGDMLVIGTTRPSAAILSFGRGPLGDGGVTTARVRRGGPDGAPHSCTDAVTGLGGGLLPAAGGALEVRLAGGGPDPFGQAGLLGTRCGGPVDADVRDLLPAARLTAAQLAAGHARVDLGAERAFAGGGFAGTLRASVVLTLGAPVRQSTSEPPRRRGGRTLKILTVRYAIESVNGRAGLSFAGLPQPELCDALDACGLTGRADLSLAATGGSLQVVTFGSGRLSRRQLMARAGLVRPRRGGHVAAFGVGSFSGGVSGNAELTGGPACRDSLAPPAGSLMLDTQGRGLTASYSPGSGPGLGGLAGRCPGPLLTDLGDEDTLATGHAAIGTLRKRRFALHLRRGVSFSGQGYAGSSTADITVVLRRGKVSVQAVPDPAASYEESLTAIAVGP